MLNSRFLICCVAWLVPGIAQANMSHISGGGAAFLLSVLGVLIFAPPLAASALFQKGRRHYSIALAAWVLVLLAVYFSYGAIPFQTRMHYSLLVFPSILAASFITYLAVALVLSHRSRKSKAP